MNADSVLFTIATKERKEVTFIYILNAYFYYYYYYVREVPLRDNPVPVRAEENKLVG